MRQVLVLARINVLVSLTSQYSIFWAWFDGVWVFLPFSIYMVFGECSCRIWSQLEAFSCAHNFIDPLQCVNPSLSFFLRESLKCKLLLESDNCWVICHLQCAALSHDEPWLDLLLSPSGLILRAIQVGCKLCKGSTFDVISFGVVFSSLSQWSVISTSMESIVSWCVMCLSSMVSILIN